MDWLDILTVNINAGDLLELTAGRVQIESGAKVNPNNDLGKLILRAHLKLISSTDKAIDLLEQYYKKSPMAIAVALKLLDHRFSVYEISPELFSDPKSMKYAVDVISRLIEAGDELLRKLNEDQQLRAGECAIAISRMSLLYDALEHSDGRSGEAFSQERVEAMRELFGTLDKKNLQRVFDEQQVLISKVMGSIGNRDRYRYLILE